MPILPPDHPERLVLADEVHARPPEAIETPARATYAAILVDHEERERELAHITGLCDRFDVAPPQKSATHFSATLGALRFKWERHGEFSGYMLCVAGSSSRPFAEPAAGFLPAGWLAAIPGRTIGAAHAKLLNAGMFLSVPAVPALDLVRHARKLLLFAHATVIASPWRCRCSHAFL